MKPVIMETENPPALCIIEPSERIRINEKFTADFRIRRTVFDMIIKAAYNLPAEYGFVIYEAFRPKERQIELWNAIWSRLQSEHPDWNDERLTIECDVFVANPHVKTSGHQAASAVDITLFHVGTGIEADMGTEMQQFNECTKTENPHITEEQRKMRNILKSALEKSGLINYPDEWWHFSYGDRLWAEITGTPETLFDAVC